MLPATAPKFRAIQILLSIVGLLIGLPATLPAQPVTNAVLRVVMDDNYPPYVFRNAQGKLEGILIDEWKLWEKKTGSRAELHGMDWGSALQRMRAGDFDVIDTIFQTEDRSALYEFSKPYARIEVPIFFRKDLSGITDIDSLHGFPVAVKRGDAAADLLQTHGINTLLLFTNYEDLVTAAASGKVNVFVVDLPPANYYLHKRGIAGEFRHSAPINVGAFHRAVLKGDHATLQLVEDGFRRISAAEHQQIQDKWMGTSLENTPILRHALYGIGAAGVLIIVLVIWSWTLRLEIRRRTAALAASEETLRLAVTGGHVGIWEWNTRTDVLFWNDELKQIFGLPESTSDLTLLQFVKAIHPEDRAWVEESFRQALAERTGFDLEFRITRPDGRIRWLGSRGHGDYDAKDNPTRMMGVALDVTERKQNEALVAGQRKALEMIATGAPLPEILEHLLNVLEAQSPEMVCSILLFDADQGRLRHGAAPRLPREFVAAVDGMCVGPEVGSCGTAVFERTPVLAENIATDPRWTHFRELALAHGLHACWSTPIFDAQNQVLGTFAVYFREPGRPTDKHRRLMEAATHTAAIGIVHHRNRQALLTLNERYARQEAALSTLTRNHALQAGNFNTILQQLTEIVARTLDVERVSVWRYTTNKAAIVCAELFERAARRHSSGTELAAALNPPYFRALADSDVIAAHDAAHDPRTEQFTAAYLQPLGITSMLDTPLHLRGDTAGVLCCEHIGPVRQWTPDEQTFAVAVANLVSMLLGQLEEQRLEEQLRHSQKMEAIGQLAGGVAHDFNNILTSMMMQADLAALHEDLPAETRDALADIRTAADRAAALTRQLLMFSRRQVMQPRPVDVDEIVTHLVKMLQRILGEDIRIELNLHASPALTQADAGMLDQVLMNLAVNARDAMPDGGRLTIETSLRQVVAGTAGEFPDVATGAYLCLAVQDTGCGIPPENLSRVFEPFFTTKAPGKGTGLGLATVFGIVKQHGGAVRVQSEPGQGARFEILLPQLTTPRETGLDPAKPAPTQGGRETILLVEDEPAVQRLTQAVLERHGYRVHAAADGPTALGLWREHREHIDLLLTDLVMPGGLGGHDLAVQLCREQPALKVVFTSGYSAELAGQELVMTPGCQFLPKPSTPQQILEIVRRTMDA